MKRYKPKHLKKRQRIGIGRLSVICICMIATITILSTGTTLSKMVSTAAGSSSAQVAAFIVEANGSKQELLTVDCNSNTANAAYSLSVTNEKNGKVSEVSIKYNIIVTLPEALPNGVTVKVGDKAGTLSADKKTYTFADVGTFPAGIKATHNCTLLFEADTNLVEDEYLIENIQVSIHTEQVD